MMSYLDNSLTLNSLVVVEGYTYSDKPLALSNRTVSIFISLCYH